MKKRLKKGFTLAELLIVVAIIAVLTAIAVPLFVTSLNKAQTAADNSTYGAVRSAASVYILNADKPADDKNTDENKIYSKEDGTFILKGPWKAVGTVDEKGNVTKVTVELATGEGIVDESGKLGANAKNTITKGDDGNRIVTVYISVTEITKA